MEGNQMKMREALAEARKVIKAMGGYWAMVTLPIIDAALSAPSRQCDVGTPEEQVERWQAFCDQFDDDCTGCTCDVAACASYTGCFARWAQTPYAEERKGEGDGK